MSYPTENTLNGCITSLSSSCSLLSQSLNSLDSQVPDFARLGRVLDQHRIFTLVPEYDVSRAKRSLVDEIEPKTLRLVELIKLKLTKLERKKSAMEGKIKLNEVRINNFRGDRVDDDHDGDDNTATVESDKLKQLRLKKDRLKYQLSSLTLQERKKSLLIG